MLRDAAGATWLVAELDASQVPGALALTCLVFDTQSVCRRFWSYPANWAALDDVSLLALMHQPRTTR